ncbi:MAG: hypothetical protein ABGW85_04630 [Sulfurimonas sp.]
MKKLLKLTLASAIVLLMASCSATGGPDADTQTASFEHFKPKHSLSEVHDLIVQAGKENGWRMTEFKDNEIIAEKVSDDNTKAVTIKFAKNYFHIEPEDGDLEDAIKDKLEE